MDGNVLAGRRWREREDRYIGTYPIKWRKICFVNATIASATDSHVHFSALYFEVSDDERF